MAEISEKELEGYICEQINNDEVYGFQELSLSGNAFSQFNLQGYGIIDILVVDIDFDMSVTVTIIELKKDAVTVASVGQISRYNTGIKKLFEEIVEASPFFFGRLKINVELMLIGKSYENSDVCFLVDSINNLTCYHYELRLNSGVYFNFVEEREISTDLSSSKKKLDIPALKTKVKKERSAYIKHMRDF